MEDFERSFMDKQDWGSFKEQKGHLKAYYGQIGHPNGLSKVSSFKGQKVIDWAQIVIEEHQIIFTLLDWVFLFFIHDLLKMIDLSYCTKNDCYLKTQISFCCVFLLSYFFFFFYI